jgi:FixJ family two-component response regulator
MDEDTEPVVIVDDDPGVRRALSRLLLSMGMRTKAFDSGDALLAASLPVAPMAVLLDLHMPGLRGAALVRAIRLQWPEVRIIVMTGHDRPGAMEDVIGAGALAYILKPIHGEDVATLLRLSRGGARGRRRTAGAGRSPHGAAR